MQQAGHSGVAHALRGRCRTYFGRCYTHPRSAADYRQVEERLAAFHELRMNAETIATTVAAHRELGQQGHHQLPIPDLLIAACAQQHQAAVLHLDRHYDVLAEVLAFEPVRLKT
jgi:predicted nucleic acid-binding protein